MNRPTSDDLVKMLENCQKEGCDGDYYYFCPACYVEGSDTGAGWSPAGIKHAKDCWIKPMLDNVCEFCGLSDDNVLFRVNPFAVEIYDDHTGHWICDGCYDSWADDL